MRRGISRAARELVRDRVPGAHRAHVAYLRWAYSHRPAARRKLFRRIDRETPWEEPDRRLNVEGCAVIREWLPEVWAELRIHRLADVPCGEFLWMSTIVDHLDYYFGGDIVPEIVDRVRERAPDWCEFRVFDLMTDEFPPVDAILVRDVLPCLSNEDVLTVLRNVCRSSARYLITTTYPEKPPQDIVTGDFRGLNLTAPPLSLPEPLRLVNEQNTYAEYFTDKSLGVWDVAELREHLGN